MLRIGQYQELKINREVDFGVYLGDGKDEVLLPTKYIPEGVEIGDTLRVFVYKDSEGRPIATTLTPKGVLGEIVSLKVNDETGHGSYMDLGIAKDLFVPRQEQHKRFEVGNRYVVRISMDHKTNRLIGTSKLQAFLRKDASEDLKEGEEVDLLIYDRSDLGWKAVINQEFVGLLYADEVPPNLQIGDSVKGFVKHIREDGKVDLRLSAEGRKGAEQGRDSLLQYLKDNEGIIYLTDKSSPEEIFSQLQMSKKLFKKALGALYRERLVELNSDHIRLVEA